MADRAPSSLTFAGHRLDLGARQLFRGADELHLSPKAFDLLQLLVERRPQAVSKTDVHDRLWPGTFVTEANLASLIAELRRALDDDPRAARFIRTVHRYGYAFCGRIESEDVARAPTETCWIVWAGREIRLQQGGNIIGRDADASVRVDFPSVSRRHARILVSADGATLEDLGSKNGTRHRNARITSRVRLMDLDELQVGSVQMTFRILSSDGATQTID